MNAGKLNITLGCYTDAAHPNGLKALCVDKAAGRMEVVAEYPVSNALYQALSPDGNWLYTCTGEGLAAFRGQGSGVEINTVLIQMKVVMVMMMMMMKFIKTCLLLLRYNRIL